MESHLPSAREIAQGVALAAFFVVVSPLAQSDDPGARALDAWAFGLLVCAGLSFAVRGRHPYAGYAVALACTVAYLLGGYGGGPIYVAPFIGLVRIVAISAPRAWIPIAVGGGTTLALAHALQEGWSWSIALSTGVWLIGALLVGEAVRARRGQEAALAARAAEAERTREEEALRRAAEERLRIAREVHDVVGHSLAVISLQAGVAAHLLRTRPEQARDAVAAIRHVSNEALDDLRAELGLLRDPDGSPPPPAAVAGLEAVPQLVASLCRAGVVVELEASGIDDADLPGAASAAGYRIIREALTNVARHAGAGSRAQVRIAHRDATVEVEVLDDGVGPAAGSNGTRDGSGLAGMRERAVALGGRLEAGAGPDGGFRVWAWLPAQRP
ncbi:MAG: sensor histidine kinase [Solirubrobacteraceae bacterium]